MGNHYGAADYRLREPFEFTLSGWTADGEQREETFIARYQMNQKLISQLTGMEREPHRQVALVRAVIGNTLPNDDGTPANWAPDYRKVRHPEGEPDLGEREYRGPDGEWHREGTEDRWLTDPSSRRRFHQFYDDPDLLLDISEALMPLVRDLAAVSAGRPTVGS